MTDTDAQVERLRDLLGKATPGPWTANTDHTRKREYGGGITMWETPVQVGAPENMGNTIASVGMGGPGAIHSGRDDVEANATLIAELRNAAPALLDTIAALKAERDGWKASYMTLRKAANALALDKDARIAALEAQVRERDALLDKIEGASR